MRDTVKQENYVQTKGCLARNMRSQHFRSLTLELIPRSRARSVYLYQKHSCLRKGTVNTSDVRILMSLA